MNRNAWMFLGAVLLAQSGCQSTAIHLYDLKSNQWVFPHFTYTQPTVLAFWNTDNVQCLDDLPALNALSHREGSVQLVTVCTSRDRRKIAKWMGYESCTFDVILDPDRRLARHLNVSSYPTYVFFNMNGSEIGRYLDIKTVHNWFDRARWIEKAEVR